MLGGRVRLGVCVFVVLVMVFSAASVVRAPGVPPVIVANADSATTEATAVPPGTVIGFSGTSSIPGTAFTWFFGDMESATGPTASHAYDADGVIDVTLVGQAPSGTMALDTVRIYIASPTYGSGGVNGALITTTPASLTADEDATFTFDCRDSWPADYNKDLLSCSWDFGDHATASGPTVSHAYGYSGTYTVRLVVRDTAGNADAERVDVTVGNLPPQPPDAADPAFGISTTTPAEDAAVLFDAFGWTDTPTDDYALEFDWDFGDGTGGANEGTYHLYSAEGPYTVTLTVRDDDGETATATRTLTVANPAPTANAGSAITVSEAQTALFSGTGTDTASDAGSLAYAWTGGSGLTGSRPTEVWYDETTITKTLQVTDVHAASATSSVTVTVQNRDPYASITNAVKSGSSVIVTGVVHEVGADSLTLTWNWGHGSPPQTSTQTFTNTAGTSPFRATWSPSHSFPVPSTWYTVTLTATDGDGGTHVATASIKGGGSGSLIDNKAPEVTAVNADQTAKAEDAAFSFTATVNNPDGPASPPTTYLWDFGDGQTATTASPSHAYARAGTYTVILKATDGAGDSGANSRQVTVTNVAPTASFTMSQANPEEDGSVVFDASASSDTASDLPALAYAWTFGDGARGSGKTPSHTYRALGSYTVTLTVTDDNGASATAPTQQVTVGNRLPTAEFRVLSPYPPTGGTVFAVTTGPPPPPANPKERQAVVFDGSLSYDGQADLATLTFDWDFGDGTYGDGRRATHAYDHQGDYMVILTVTDEHLDPDQAPDTVLGLPLTVDNTPAVPFAGPDRYAYGAEAPLHFLAAAEDDDAEPLTYLWDWGVDCTPPLACPIGVGPDVYFAYTETGVYTVTLTVTDTTGSSATDTATINVNMDSDGDQLSDEFEMGAWLNPYDPDTDHDLILDATEILGGTDPTSDDSDNDGLNDWEELFVGDDGYTTHPLDPDTDGDTLGDGMENGLCDPPAEGWAQDTSMPLWNGGLYYDPVYGYVVYGPDRDPQTTTDPTDPDTDNDGLPDGWTDGANGDPQDGLPQTREGEDRNLNGAMGVVSCGGLIGPPETDPNLPDTDADGVEDGVEVRVPGRDADTGTETDPLDDDFDDDGVLDGTEDIDGNGRRDGNDPTDTESDWSRNYGPGEMDPLDPDTDDDHLSDGLEVGLSLPMGVGTASPPWNGGFGGPDSVGFGPDADTSSTTDPLDIDSDDDGLPDGWVDLDGDTDVDADEVEDRNYNGAATPGAWNGGAGPGETDPTTIDTDQDEWNDRDEILVFLTDPVLTDTDADGVRDGREFLTDPNDADTDDDGLKDGTEDRNGDGFRDGDDPTDASSDWDGGQGLGETDPIEFDTDGDGLSDGLETGRLTPETSDTDANVFEPDTEYPPTTDPLAPDTDADGLEDGLEDTDADGSVDAAETDPNDLDTDSDGLTDGAEDADRDGTRDAGETDPVNEDSEAGGGDGMPDGWEVANNLFPLQDDAGGNSDGDGLANLAEFQVATDPNDSDTDDDFLPDGDDIRPTAYDIDPEAPTNPKIQVEVPDFTPDGVYVSTIDSDTVVSLAVDFTGPAGTGAAITECPQSSCPHPFDGPGLVDQVIEVVFPTGLIETAILKIQYPENPTALDSSGNPVPADEHHLLLYRWQGGDVGQWVPMKHQYVGEESWRNVAHNYVWANATEDGYFAIADSTLRDFDGDGWTDGEEFNLDAYDPDVLTLCQSPMPIDCKDASGAPNPVDERESWDLSLGATPLQDGVHRAFLYLLVPVEPAAIETVVEEPETGTMAASPTIELSSWWEESADPVISTGTNPDEGPRTVAGSNWIAQSFLTGSAAFTIGRVEVYLKIDVAGDPVSELLLDLREDTGNTLITASPEVGVPSTYGWVSFDLMPNPGAPLLDQQILSANTVYWLVLRSPPDGGEYSVMVGTSPVGDDTRVRSKASSDGGATWPTALTGDVYMRLYATSLPTDLSFNIWSEDTENDDYERVFPGVFDYRIPYAAAPYVLDLTPEIPALDQRIRCAYVPGVYLGCVIREWPTGNHYAVMLFEFRSSTPGILSIERLRFTTFQPPFNQDDLLDPDGDGLSTWLEENVGIDPLDCLHPDDPDSDGDGLKDGAERRWWEDSTADSDSQINACDSDSDGDGMLDGWDDVDRDQTYDLVEPMGEWNYRSSPLRADTDGDTLNDGPEAVTAFIDTSSGINYAGHRNSPWDRLDADNDGLWNGPTDPDSDGDGLRDDFEANTNWDVRRDLNSDGDTDDPDEVIGGLVRSRPWLADSDGEGLPDNEEWGDGTSPTSPLLTDTDEDDLEDDEESAGYTEVNGACVFWMMVYGKILYNVGGKTYTVTHGGTTDSFPAGDRSTLYYDGAAFDTFQDWVIDGSPGTDGDYTMVNVGVRGGTAVSGSLTILQWTDWNDGGTWGVTIRLWVNARASPLIRDTDHDGLRDGWEVHGAPGVPLQEYGANPVMPDIFVEVDFMADSGHSHAPSEYILGNMRNVFIENGVSVHVDTGGNGGGGAISHDSDISMGERNALVNGVGGPSANEGFTQPRRGIFYYWLYSHDSTTLKVYPSQEGGNYGWYLLVFHAQLSGDWVRERWLLMHEFGHSLLDEIDNPNYRTLCTDPDTNYGHSVWSDDVMYQSPDPGCSRSGTDRWNFRTELWREIRDELDENLP